MALVSKILGDCPSCGRKDGYGIVNVSGNTLNRGCLSCRHWDRTPLPALDKKVIYLDQYFYSHAFRGSHPSFVEAKGLIQEVAASQLAVAPYSNVHEDETHLWSPEKRDDLMKFIKQTSAGHRFNPEYQVQITQIANAFGAFLKRDSTEAKIIKSDALPDDLNDWDDYLWIDVPAFKPDVEKIRSSKTEAVASLMDLFEEWAARSSTFDQDVKDELRGGQRSYTKSYVEYAKRIANGEIHAMFDSPVASQIVETLMHYDGTRLPATIRMQRIQAFFESEYFENVPLERISSEFFALLRHRLRLGAYRNKTKAQSKFKGFFYDVRFIAAYAPYCDAMVVDALMHSWATDPLIDLPRKFGTRFFSRTNWGEFLDYLRGILRSKSDEVAAALRLIHPSSYKVPEWISRGIL